MGTRPTDAVPTAMDTDSRSLVSKPGERAYRTVRAETSRPIRQVYRSGISEHAKRKIKFQTVEQVDDKIIGRKRKRQKIRDQMKGSIDCPPPICHEIQGVDTSQIAVDQQSFGTGMSVTTNGLEGLMMVDRGLTYYCPSKSVPGQIHRIGLKIEDGITRFSCTCDHMGGRFDPSKNSCSHIRATVIKIVMDLIQTHQIAIDVNELSDLMSAMMV